LISSRLRHLFPAEHGATAIWLYSTLAGILSPNEPISALGLVVAVAASTIVYFAAALFVRALKLSRYMRNNMLVLAVGSASLTLFMLLNHYILVGVVDSRALAIWLLLLSYTVAATLSARVRVRNLLFNTRRFDLPILVGASVLISECILLTLSSLLSYTALFSVTALFLPALINWLTRGGGGGRSSRIKIIGISYMLTGMVFVAFISRS